MRLNRLAISIRMPTEREYSKHEEPELKREHYPARRLRFLDHSIGGGDSRVIVKAIVIVLALYGLYHLIF